jgi:hypothetical protein
MEFFHKAMPEKAERIRQIKTLPPHFFKTANVKGVPKFSWIDLPAYINKYW